MPSGRARQRKMPLRELVVILMLGILLILLALPIIRNSMDTRIAATCQGNLKQWATVFAMYRAENNHFNPLVHGYESFGSEQNAPGCANIDDEFDFAPELKAIFPDYATNTAILACPEASGLIPAIALGPIIVRVPTLDPAIFAIANGSCDAAGSITRPGARYTYFGFEMKYANDEDLQVSQSQAHLAGLPATGPANLVALLERFQIDDDTTVELAQGSRGTAFNRGDYMQPLGYPYYGADLGFSLLGPLNDVSMSMNTATAMLVGVDHGSVAAQYPTMAVMWDSIRQDSMGNPVFNHNNASGCNVLYMDGHVEFRTYPGAFPVSKTFAAMRPVH